MKRIIQGYGSQGEKQGRGFKAPHQAHDLGQGAWNPKSHDGAGDASQPKPDTPPPSMKPTIESQNGSG